MNLVEFVHAGYVHSRRSRVLADHLAEMIPSGACVLDVGCGDGLLADLVLRQRPDLTVRGIDVLVRPETHIAVAPFDGHQIPYPDGSLRRRDVHGRASSRGRPDGAAPRGSSGSKPALS